MRLSLSRAVLLAQSMRDAQRSQRRRLSPPTPTLGAKTKSRRSDRIWNHKERTRCYHPEHQAGKASTTTLRACLPPSNAMAPLVRSSPYCCALLLRAATVARVDAHVLRDVALLDEILGPAFRHHRVHVTTRVVVHNLAVGPCAIVARDLWGS